MSETDFVNTFLTKQREYTHDFLSRLIMAETNNEIITKTNESLTQENINLKETLNQSLSGTNTELDRVYMENNKLREELEKMKAKDNNELLVEMEPDPIAKTKRLSK
jgi:predicted RNA-binding protein with EMAP domain